MLGRFPKDDRKEIMETANDYARKAGKDHAGLKEVEAAAKAVSPEDAREIIVKTVIMNIGQALRLLPKDIPWFELDDLERLNMRTGLQKVMDRALLLLDSEQEKPVPKQIDRKR
jgi:hypothetical protein